MYEGGGHIQGGEGDELTKEDRHRHEAEDAEYPAVVGDKVSQHFFLPTSANP